jgi:hypothetical protein
VVDVLGTESDPFLEVCRMFRNPAGTLVVAALGVVTLVGGARAEDRSPREINPRVLHGRNKVEGFAPTAGGKTALSPIQYHNGPVMGTPKAYLIWYGNWNQGNGSDTPAGQALVRTFLAGIGGSSYYKINTTYAASGGAPTGSVTLSGSEYTDTGSLGTRLSDANIQTIVTNAINSGKLPKDTAGIYFVLTSSNVTERTGFCTKYCGWHTSGTIAGADIKYSFVGNANRCLSSCAAQTTSPNGNAGVDGMLSVVAHELEEANSDPDLNAWYDASGAENADKCAWTFGSAQTLSGGAYSNMTLGGKRFLVQRNLDAQDNKCYVAYKGQQ